jgi:hypothetical protein
MKNFVFIVLTMLTTNVFSQSYLVLGNGVALTIDRAGFVYDLGHFFLPHSIKISGGSFFVSDDRLQTIDDAGYLYRKEEKFKKIKGKGLNYIVGDDHKLYTVSQQGFLFKFEDPSFRRISATGGNYFLVTHGNKSVDLYTLNDKGNYFKIQVPGLDTKKVQLFPGRYFRTGGTVYTVSRDGFIYSKSEFAVKDIIHQGGNFFVDSSGKLFTVSEEGYLLLPVLPADLVVSKIAKVGANYLLDREGQIFVVDGDGSIHEREVPHDLTNARTLSI